MITLPVKIKTTMLKSFWIVFCSVSLIIISLLLWFIFEADAFLYIIFTIPIVILPGYLYPESITGMYKLFNRIIRKIVREIRGFTLRIIYYVFYFSIRKNSKEPNQQNQLKTGSGWRVKKIEELSGYEIINEVARDFSRPTAELGPFIKWIVKSKKWNALPAIPFVIILSFLTIDDEKVKTAENTYTLY